jgi:hypothetical protein
VRRWLRGTRGVHTEWLRRQGMDHAHDLDSEVLADLGVQRNPLGDALQALAAAVAAYRSRFKNTPKRGH